MADHIRPLYADMGNYLASRFPYKVQKISLNAGFFCPNRGRPRKGGAVVLTAITRLSAPITVIRGGVLRSNSMKVLLFLLVNIPR